VEDGLEDARKPGIKAGVMVVDVVPVEDLCLRIRIGPVYVAEGPTLRATGVCIE
jgi:hypothetical protein